MGFACAVAAEHEEPAFGLGGVFVEAMRDVVFRIAPVSRDDSLDMMASIRGEKLLDGMRGAPAVNRSSVASVICRVGQLAVENSDTLELDINPLLGRAHDAIALDARVRVR